MKNKNIPTIISFIFLIISTIIFSIPFILFYIGGFYFYQYSFQLLILAPILASLSLLITLIVHDDFENEITKYITILTGLLALSLEIIVLLYIVGNQTPVY